MRKTSLHLIQVLIAVAILSMGAASVFAQKQQPFTLIIDPGHGGKDYGCVGKLTNEKTIVLDVAKRLGEIISREHPEIAISYTRDTDRYLTLQQRADKANEARGDLFVSIHVNSIDKRARNRTTIKGASVYTLGLHKNDNNLNVAMRENAVMELEPDYSAKYHGFDPNSSESYIMFELNQNSHVSNSIELAAHMQKELISTAGRADKSVRQAGFWVLWAVAMPSVLVELDFICNPQMEKFLHSDAGKDKCARALANAFASYYARHNKGIPAQNQIRNEKNDDIDGHLNEPPASDTNEIESKPTYHVQFLTSGQKLKSGDSRLKGVADVNFYYENKLYKYYSGTYPSIYAAKKALAQIRKKHPEAFIIKMRDGKRL